ncbi:hypothetical protein PISMIDRAFT_437492 [Pisolithus microcarpus 441]|uniref:Uncharacterized protein n=1 Tax=Pisolithus microcarpus 441 TaxID=765257 RepID=A0A0C9Y6D8_9AGAM|nr:hypothetical protein PISMIDRAFT_437492 [Pisolithus microcarpus 441]
MYLDERLLRLSPLRLSSVLMYILANYCDAPELAVVEGYVMVVAGPHGNPPLEPPLGLLYVGETLNQTAPVHRVPMPTIVVRKSEVFDKGKNMWKTSCRISVAAAFTPTSSPNAAASQPSIVHIGCA